MVSWMQPDGDDTNKDESNAEEEEDIKESDANGKDTEDAGNEEARGNDDDSKQENENEEAEHASSETEDDTEDDGEEEEKGWSEKQISKAERICNEMSQPSSSLVDLLFDEYPRRQFPSWMISSSLAESFQNLAYLQLIGLPCCTQLPPLGTLPQLKHLRIERASTVTTIDSHFLGSRSSAFPKLELLVFKDMPKWEEWTFNEATIAMKLFPSLKNCVLIDCRKLRALPACLYHATNFNELYLRQTDKLKEIINLPLDYKLVVTNGSELKKISNISSVRYLEVDNCPNLECVENLNKLRAAFGINMCMGNGADSAVATELDRAA